MEHSLTEVPQTQAAIAQVLEDISEHFLWLDEILAECKNTFSTASVDLLPKTPCQKRQPRKRAKRPLTDEFDSVKESDDGTESQEEPPPKSTSETPVRRLRSTRSRTAQSSTSSKVTRSSRASSKKAEDKKNQKIVKIVLDSQSVSESTETLSPASSNSDDTVEAKMAGVRQKARAYETMLSERKQQSPLTPKSDRKTTPKNTSNATPKVADEESEPAAIEVQGKGSADEHDVIDNSQASRRSSLRKSTTGKRTSYRVLGSKARMRSMHGRLSVNGPCATYPPKCQQGDKSAVIELLATEGKQPSEEESAELQNGESQEQSAVGKSKAPRTRLRLKKTDKSAEASQDSGSDQATVEVANESAAKDVAEDIKENQDADHAPTRTKRKKSALSSEDEHAKTCTDETTESENGGLKRTRTKARKMDAAATDRQAQMETESQKSSEEDKSSGLDSNDTGKTRTRTRAGKVADVNSSEQTSEEMTDSEGSESVFEPPTSKQQPISGGRLSEQSPVKSTSTTDSGVGSTSTKSVADETKEFEQKQSLSDVIVVAESDSKAAPAKSVEASRRETRVISRANVEEQEEEEEMPTRSTRTKTRQMQAKAAENSVHNSEDEEPRMTRTKTKKRQAEEEAETSASKKPCVETPPKEAAQDMDEVVQEADDDSDYEDIETEDVHEVRTVPSFLNQFRKSSLSHSSSKMVTSFLKRNTPPKKYTFQHLQEQKKKELLEKEKREMERLSRLDEIKRTKAEENKRKREDRMRKVAEMREMRLKKEEDLKKSLAEKMKERLNSKDKLKEDKFKEEREKQRLRLKRQIETDDRRRQEEEQRLKKLLEQEAEKKQFEELMKRKREQEEQERQRRLAEELKRAEERLAEAERQRLAEKERLRLQELEREKERQKEREEKEKRAALERAERARQEIEKRKERERNIQKHLEQMKTMEQQRLAQMAAKDDERRREEARIQQIVQEHNRNLQNLGYTSTLTLTSATTTNSSKTVSKHQPNPDSYPISPVRQKKNGSFENYDIGDLKSDDSTDDDEAPRKKIPTWAQGTNLKTMLINQVYYPPDLDSIFAYIEPPNLNEMFERKRPRFNKRTSSAVWNSPLHKPY